MHEFTTSTIRLEIHFKRCAKYFTSDKRKIAEGVSELSDSFLLNWAHHEKDLGSLDRESINSPSVLSVILSTYVAKRARITRIHPKRPSNPDFAAYLAQWEA